MTGGDLEKYSLCIFQHKDQSLAHLFYYENEEDSIYVQEIDHDQGEGEIKIGGNI